MADGFFSGGFAQGLNQSLPGGVGGALGRGIGLGQRNRALDLQERQTEADIEAQRAAEQRKQLEALAKDIKGTRDAIFAGVKDGSMDPDRAKQALSTFYRGSRAVLQALGTSAEVETARGLERIDVFRTEQEKADLANTEKDIAAQGALDRAPTVGATSAAESSAKLRAGLGRDPTPQEMAKELGVLIEDKSFSDPFVNQFGQFAQRNEQTGEIKVLFTPRSGEVIETLPGGGVRISRGSAARAALDSPASVPEKEVGEIRESLRTTVGELSELDKSINDFETTPEAGGLLGTMIENAGGVAKQIAGFVGAEELLDFIPTAEVTEVRTRARALTSRMLTTITQEESRFTDEERRIAGEVLSTLTPTSENQQILAALNTARDISTNSHLRDLNRLAFAGRADISSTEGREKMLTILMGNGFSLEEALDGINLMMQRGGLSLGQ